MPIGLCFAAIGGKQHSRPPSVVGRQSRLPRQDFLRQVPFQHEACWRPEPGARREAWDEGLAEGCGDARQRRDAAEGRAAAFEGGAGADQRLGQEHAQRAGMASAGDAGPVVLRRLNNAEYNFTIQDLTGVDLYPAREFPPDSAAGEGFTNTGSSLVMSPAMLTKYFDAGKEIAKHANCCRTGSGSRHPPRAATGRTTRWRASARSIVPTRTTAERRRSTCRASFLTRTRVAACRSSAT